MIYVLYTIFFTSCVVLIATVLLQPGKTDAGALFTSNVSSAAFGPRGTATVLSKVTIAAAAIFMISALLISMPSLSGSRSVLQANEEAPANAAIAPANANSVSTDANSVASDANLVVPANANAVIPTNANTAPAAVPESAPPAEGDSEPVNTEAANK
ncbi:MAG: preprotein translocase subunit SecG [Pyrinomonadaceae bacterium]